MCICCGAYVTKVLLTSWCLPACTWHACMCQQRLTTCLVPATVLRNPLQETLNKVLVFNKMERHLQRKVVSEMYERTVSAGEILIKEGDTGLAAAELYVVKSGKFEVRLGKAKGGRSSSGSGSRMITVLKPYIQG